MNTDRKIKAGLSRRSIALVLLAALAAAAVISFIVRQKKINDDRSQPISEAIQQQANGQKAADSGVPAGAAVSRPEDGAASGQNATPADISQDGKPAATGPKATARTSGGKAAIPSPCGDLTAKLNDFFTYLDSRDYLREYPMPGGSRQHAKSIAARLFANPPVIKGETDSLFSIMQNTAHLYRVLGKADLALLKAIITREKSRMEHDFALFYTWAANDSCRSNAKAELDLALPLDGLYEYASFLLNTLGGQSYLFRRDAHIRALASYYSILVVDLANDRGMNRHAIDLNQPAASLAKEIGTLTSLHERDEYLQELQRIRKKYAPAGK